LEAFRQLVELKNAIDVFEFTAVLNQAVAERARLEILRSTAQTHAAAGEKGIEIGVKFNAIGLKQAASKLGLNVAFGDKNSTARIDRLAISPELDLFWRLRRLCEGFNLKSGLFRDRIDDRIADDIVLISQRVHTLRVDGNSRQRSGNSQRSSDPGDGAKRRQKNAAMAGDPAMCKGS
jgi:hypothetical protein